MYTSGEVSFGLVYFILKKLSSKQGLCSCNKNGIAVLYVLLIGDVVANCTGSVLLCTCTRFG
jgi:hypothetical protein